MAFTFELQRRLQGRGITAYSTSPGLVNSSLFNSFPWYMQWAIRPVAPLLFRTPEQVRAILRVGAFLSSLPLTPPTLPSLPLSRVMHPQGAQSSIYAATSPELEGRNVLFIHNDKPHKHSVGPSCLSFHSLRSKSRSSLHAHAHSAISLLSSRVISAFTPLSQALANDPELTEKLWLASERYVGLTEAEKALE